MYHEINEQPLKRCHGGVLVYSNVTPDGPLANFHVAEFLRGETPIILVVALVDVPVKVGGQDPKAGHLSRWKLESRDIQLRHHSGLLGGRGCELNWPLLCENLQSN